MKKHNVVALLGLLFVVMLPGRALAFTQEISLTPGWNIVSTPRVLEKHEFSKPETIDNFNIYALDPSRPSGWATMSELGQSEFKPLYGYFVNNRSATTEKLKFTYKDNLQPNERIFGRYFSTPGWYSFGPANPNLMDLQGDSVADSNNPGELLKPLSDAIANYRAVVDFSPLINGIGADSVKVGSQWDMRYHGSSPLDDAQVNQLADLRELRGYGVYISASTTLLGFQNSKIPECADGIDNDGDGKIDLLDGGCLGVSDDSEAPFDAVVAVKFSSGAANPDIRIVFVSDTAPGDKVVMNEFKIKAEGTKITFDQLKADVTFSASNLSNEVAEFQLVRNGSVIGTVDPTGLEASSTSPTTSVITFNLDTSESVNMGETITYQIVAKMQQINTATFVQGDNALVSLSNAPIIAKDLNGDIVSVAQFSGSSFGKTQTFLATGLNVTKVSSNVSATTNSNTPSASFGTFTYDVKVTASGDDVWVPFTASSTAIAGVRFSVEDSNNTDVTAAGTTTASVALVLGGTRDGSTVKIADGESATLEVVVTYDPSVAGQYRLQVGSVGYNTTSAATGATLSITAAPESDFQSSNLFITN